MDIRSIVRVFRFNELQSKADRDPDSKRPPTVKFLGLALVLGLLLVGISFWTAPKAEVSGAVPLAVDSTGPVRTNTTDETPPTAQAAPAPGSDSDEEETVARPQS